MSKSLWLQRLTQLNDIPKNDVGAIDATPGEVLIVNPTGDGIAFAPAGSGGTAGPPGPPTSISIGTVNPGTVASATMTGSAPLQTLNLVLPKGDTGPAGTQGVKGDTGSQGVPGVAGATGPKGDTGAKGDQGIQGVAGPQGAGLVPDGFGQLTDDFVSTTETNNVRYIYVVNSPDGDTRSNLNVPANLAGDQSRNIIGYDPVNGWRSYGPFTGIQGPAGIQGVQGLPGAQGSAGPQGDVGPRGLQGDQGIQGIQGVQGPKGDTGDTGPAADTSNLLNKTGDTTTGVIVFGKAIDETKTAIAASNIDLALGSVYSKTISAATTFTLSNKSGTTDLVQSFILELTNPGAFVITWWSGVKWDKGTAPTWTVAGVDIVGFYSYDMGVTWRGILLAQDSK